MIMLQLTLMIIIMGNAYGLKVRDLKKKKKSSFPMDKLYFYLCIYKKILLKPKSAYLFDIMHKQIILLCLKWKKTSFWYTVEALSYKILRRVIKDMSQLCFFLWYSAWCEHKIFSQDSTQFFWAFLKQNLFLWDCFNWTKWNLNFAKMIIFLAKFFDVTKKYIDEMIVFADDV